jgi:ABC-type transport system involved in multi-copper enzyme maturation permease subunit
MHAIVAVAGLVWLETIRRKDVYVLLILAGALLALLLSVGSFGLAGATRYVKDVGFLLAWLFGWILAVSVAARQLPNEEGTGTIYPLLAKPITRLQLVLGKWLGAWSIVTAGALFFALIVTGVALLRGGTVHPGALAQAVVLQGGALAVLCALALLLSTRLHADAALALTFVCTAAAQWLVPRVPALSETAPPFSSILLQAVYHILPHLEVLDMRLRLVHDYGPLDTPSFLLAAGYAATLTALFLALAWTVYRRRRFTRGDAR